MKDQKLITYAYLLGKEAGLLSRVGHGLKAFGQDFMTGWRESSQPMRSLPKIMPKPALSPKETYQQSTRALARMHGSRAAMRNALWPAEMREDVVSQAYGIPRRMADRQNLIRSLRQNAWLREMGAVGEGPMPYPTGTGGLSKLDFYKMMLGKNPA